MMPVLAKVEDLKIPKKPFQSCGRKPLGFYGIVDDLIYLERLLQLNVKTLQLRIKDKRDSLELEIKTAIELSQKYQAKLFINDHWQLAMKHGAYGVHLGQGDLQGANLMDIQTAGVRLGISTHSLEEARIACACNPSYIALGPIYETTAKEMPYAPQGLEKIKEWKQRFSFPLVAIGGMNLERGKAAYEAGADSVAVMYAGQIVEVSDAKRFFEKPLHPYAEMLMASVPKIGRKEEPIAITGAPPSLINPPTGCRFKDRCPARFSKCDEMPPVIKIDEDRQVRCWLHDGGVHNGRGGVR